MNKSLKLIIVSMVLIFISCEKTDLTQGETNTVASKINPSNPVSIAYTDVKAWNINNGLPNTCSKNILVFPSWTRYNQVIDYLDQQTEIYCDAFDAQWGNLPDEEYDAKCDSLGFDEDNKLLQLENNFAFCSLRKKLNTLEDAWLDVQGDGVWNANEDPDNHFIDDDTERALLNEGVEVIIGPTDTKRTQYILYKFNADGSYYTIALTTQSATSSTITNTGAISALQQINNGTYVAGSNTDVTLILKIDTPPAPDCEDSNAFRQYFSTSSNTKIKAVDKYSHITMVSDPKVKAKTTSYKKKNNGGWKKKRAWITAQLVTVSGIQCGSGLMPAPEEKTKRRKNVKVKWDGSDLQSLNPGMVDDATFGIHKRESVTYNVDLFNGQAQ